MWRMREREKLSILCEKYVALSVLNWMFLLELSEWSFWWIESLFRVGTCFGPWIILERTNLEILIWLNGMKIWISNYICGQEWVLFIFFVGIIQLEIPVYLFTLVMELISLKNWLRENYIHLKDSCSLYFVRCRYSFGCSSVGAVFVATYCITTGPSKVSGCERSLTGYTNFFFGPLSLLASRGVKIIFLWKFLDTKNVKRAFPLRLLLDGRGGSFPKPPHSPASLVSNRGENGISRFSRNNLENVSLKNSFFPLLTRKKS